MDSSLALEERRRPTIENTKLVEEPMKKAYDGLVHHIKTTKYTLTEGIVSSTSKTYLPMLWDYDRHLCETVFSLYDTSCIVLSRVFNSNNTVDVQPSQIKAFAVLFSSFEDVIYMDPWSLPTYTSTVNSIYYNISGQPVPSIAARLSSFTSAFSLSKRSHLTTLLLNAYYNCHDPSYYYPLFMQGALGDPGGDSLLLAAAALGRSFLMIQDPEADMGYQAMDDEFYSSALVQIDPQTDHFHRKQPVRQTDLPFAFFWSGLTSNNKRYRLRTQWVTPQGELSCLTEGPEWAHWSNVQSTNCILKESAVNMWKTATAEYCKGLQNDICLLPLLYWKMATQAVTISQATSRHLPVASLHSILDRTLAPPSESREPVKNSPAVSSYLTSGSWVSMLHSTLPSIPEVPEPDTAPPSS
ncbi:hypothetical protein BDW42DRAFT_188421 [Aspergillus taichungensis]|uniref:Uncharacterized protein n=1 Tax=Aspergillus taichungensis TaxID=482145 RepID=A0A2J5HID1_9EURO|nr:hypothetical protein BDW42DRAFT_188421 [Aspergillus taichungensis]